MYVIDSDVLIAAKNGHYAFDIVPAFWEWLANEHLAGKVFLVQKVADEILAGGDELAEWVKAQPASFRLAPGPGDTASLASVAQWANNGDYEQQAVAQFLSVADYYLVAQALNLGYTVVTHEKPEPNAKRRIKIPDACNAVGVTWMNPFEMLKVEQAKFVL